MSMTMNKYVSLFIEGYECIRATFVNGASVDEVIIDANPVCYSSLLEAEEAIKRVIDWGKDDGAPMIFTDVKTYDLLSHYIKDDRGASERVIIFSSYLLGKGWAETPNTVVRQVEMIDDMMG